MNYFWSISFVTLILVTIIYKHFNIKIFFVVNIFLYLCLMILMFIGEINYYKYVPIFGDIPETLLELCIVVGVETIAEVTPIYQFFFFPYMTLVYILIYLVSKKLKNRNNHKKN